MRHEQVKHLKPAEFKRFWGVTYETFEKMVEIVRLHSQQKKKTGRPGKVSLEDQVLISLLCQLFQYLPFFICQSDNILFTHWKASD
jgi:hypothetical protein